MFPFYLHNDSKSDKMKQFGLMFVSFLFCGLINLNVQ